MLESIGYVYVRGFKTGTTKIWIAKSVTFWIHCKPIIILTGEPGQKVLIKVK